MPGSSSGNSRRRGAVRKRRSGNPTAGSGGRIRRGLEGKGPTPRAEDRPNHKAYHKKKAAERSASGAHQRGPAKRRAGEDGPEWIVGRNSVVEAMRSGVPAKSLHLAERIDRDDRVREALRLAAESNLPLLETPRGELDRITSGTVHQGLALQVPAYEYAHPDDLLERAYDDAEAPLVIALDGVTDPRNLGAVVRSAGAFGAHGVLVPQRRAAAMTGSAWKSSAGAAARVPVARAVNLTRALKSYQRSGLTVVGLDASGTEELPAYDGLNGPLAIVVGSEGGGLSRLVGETCDVVARIPMHAASESLNAGVAAGIALYEAARHR